VDCLLCAGLIGNDAVVIEIPNHRQIQYALLCVNVRNIRYPFTVRSVCMKLSVEQILVLVDLLPHLLPFPAATDFRKQTVFLHDTKDGLGIAVNALLLQHHPHPTIAIRAKARSEEHTSELQSRFDLVCRLLLEKKKNSYQTKTRIE